MNSKVATHLESDNLIFKEMLLFQYTDKIPLNEHLSDITIFNNVPKSTSIAFVNFLDWRRRQGRNYYETHCVGNVISAIWRHQSQALDPYCSFALLAIFIQHPIVLSPDAYSRRHFEAIIYLIQMPHSC